MDPGALTFIFPFGSITRGDAGTFGLNELGLVLLLLIGFSISLFRKPE